MEQVSLFPPTPATRVTMFHFRTQTSSRLLPGCSYGCCIHNLHPGSLAPVPRGCASSIGIDGVRWSLFCLAVVHGAGGVVVYTFESHMVSLCSASLFLCILLCPAPFADLAWFVAWSSRLPCRSWRSITSSRIITMLPMLLQWPGLCCLNAALWLLPWPGLCGTSVI
jgi:hypothetical protein